MTTKESLKLEIPRLLWYRLIVTLRARGQRRRESGAFLLSQLDEQRVRHFVPYDDLDPSALDKGYIYFNGSGFIRLWDLCAEKNLRVIADIHTHPGDLTCLSDSDWDNPMIPQPGHMALIVPKYAQANSFKISGVGTHLYLGDCNWRTFKQPEDMISLTLL